MVQKVWENRGASEAGFRYLVFTKETADSATFDASMVYGLLDGSNQDSNGVSVNALTEAAAGFVIGFKIEDFTTIGASLTAGQANFTYLNKVLFGDSVTTLETNIFQDSGVSTLAITRNISNIDLSVFGGSNVGNITVDANNEDFSTENEYLYTKDKSKLILCPPGNSRLTVRLNDNTTTIGEEAFIFNTTITTLYLSNVTTIETRAFKKTTALKEVYGIRSDTVGTDAFDQSAAEAVVTIALGVTDRFAESSSATITYDPASPKTATSIDQTYDVTATVTMTSDNTLVATKIFSETVFAVSNSAPIFTSPTTLEVNENETEIGGVAATDPDGGTVSYSITGGPDANTSNPYYISISSTGNLTFNRAPNYENPGSAAGTNTYTIIVTASDDATPPGSTSETITVNVINVDEPPTIGYKSYSAPQVPNKLEVEVTNDGDARADTYSYQWERSSDNGANWTKIDGATSATYVFTSEDKTKSFRAVVSFTYNDGNDGTANSIARPYNPPTWNNGEPVPDDKKTATVGEVYTYRPTDNAEAATYHLLENPSWLVLSPGNTLPLTGTPKVADIGKSQTVKLAVVEDSVFYMASVLEFNIKILPFKPADKDALQSAIDKWYALANDPKDTNAVTTANNYDGPEYFGNPKTWDTSLITDLSYVFYKKDQTNHPDISTWDVSNVTSMQGTFSNSTFNGELKNWNVASVTDFSYTFANNVVFNQSLKRWNVQDAITMESMFDNAYSFNQTIEPPMVQNKDGTDFPTQLTWDENTINGYLTKIYGSATPQTNPTTFKGVFGMIALLKKTYLNALNTPTYNTIKSSFSEVMSELTTNQQEILKYNYTYDGEKEKWIPTSPTIYFANTDGKTGDDLNDAKDKLNKLRLNTIVDGMLLINKAYDIAKKDLGETGYSTLINEMKIIYDDVYAGLPFYVAWYAPLLTTKANFLNNALTMQSGKEGTINQSLKDFIDTNPIKSINGETYFPNDKLNILFFSSVDLFDNFKAAYTP